MTAVRCKIHAIPVRDATLCPHCQFDVEKDLGDIPALTVELDITLSRQTALGYREGGKSAEEPLPYNVNASTVAAELNGILTAWVRVVHATVGGLTPAADTTALSRFLLARIALIRQLPDAGHLHDQLGYTVGQARKVVDRPKNRSRVFVGVCLEDCCDGELWATFPLADYDPMDPTTHAAITCAACPVTYPADQWLRVGSRLLRRVS